MADNFLHELEELSRQSATGTPQPVSRLKPTNQGKTLLIVHSTDTTKLVEELRVTFKGWTRSTGWTLKLVNTLEVTGAIDESVKIVIVVLSPEFVVDDLDVNLIEVLSDSDYTGPIIPLRGTPCQYQTTSVASKYSIPSARGFTGEWMKTTAKFDEAAATLGQTLDDVVRSHNL